ncbi:rhodanese-like domain-containing protein [Tenacibaculum dicentrarchi]|uniref:Sulfurtransferase n=1 Tax=Tenacibaculum dicentrarchi TaxID=669041 RepID=A0ABP1EF14_9FLAO|nr:rhodanese-like domain-containing protein [Tenacibaculum dicentrarchi]MCD8407943.1 rhodanese-like domain-containing protein [Tenacibaculum dicentrarchi]MCD8415183.1 rhodanese-like domain-containing protein [Tenacibaculum dicentrarchi]MCD8420318.1 rhodanese-like domain-containing protein [Tenacibaculum dicentrarchi]MCD8425354.1 rhodanese-like domain-containing protein [Tenacibaculum dicentrarchi]
MGLFNLFRKKNMGEKIQEYLGNQAIILDVRTLEEWNEGHSEGAKHIVLTTISARFAEIKEWKKPVIAVCRSGARSGQATDFLVAQGIDVINGGPWQNVDQYLTK